MQCIQFLKEIFAYLDHWKVSVDARKGFSDDEKKTMTLSKTTENGMRMTGMLVCVAKIKM